LHNYNADIIITNYHYSASVTCNLFNTDIVWVTHFFYFQTVNNSNYLKATVVYFMPKNLFQLCQVSKRNKI